MESQSLQQSVKPETLEIIKQLKAEGSFDKFRKDCFAEIIAQPQFHDLTKNVEDYVLRFLKEQKPNSKKSLIRDKLRRSLNESYFLTSGINKLIDETMEPKLQSTLAPLLNKMIANPPKPQQTTHPSNYANNSPPEAAVDTENHHQHSITPKLSVEDFIPTTTATVTATVPKPVVEKSSKAVVVKGPKVATTVAVTNKTVVRKTTETVKHVKSSPSAVVDTGKKSGVSTDLEADPTHQYRFNWQLNSFDDLDYDEFSISSVDSSDITDLDELDALE